MGYPLFIAKLQFSANMLLYYISAIFTIKLIGVRIGRVCLPLGRVRGGLIKN
jgi:hypothetical protein